MYRMMIPTIHKILKLSASPFLCHIMVHFFQYIRRREIIMMCPWLLPPKQLQLAHHHITIHHMPSIL
jgi:hypothetical protein